MQVLDQWVGQVKTRILLSRLAILAVLCGSSIGCAEPIREEKKETRMFEVPDGWDCVKRDTSYRLTPSEPNKRNTCAISVSFFDLPADQHRAFFWDAQSPDPIIKKSRVTEGKTQRNYRLFQQMVVGNGGREHRLYLGISGPDRFALILLGSNEETVFESNKKTALTIADCWNFDEQPPPTLIRKGIQRSDRMTLRGHTDGISSLCFSPDGQLLASVGSYPDNSVKLWNVKSGEEVRTLRGHSAGVHAVCFAPDGKTLFSAAGVYNPQTFLVDGGEVRLWDTKSGQLKTTLSGHRARVSCIAVSPDGKLLASGSWDKTIKLWELSSRRLVMTLEGQAGEINSLSFHPDNKTLASGSGSFLRSKHRGKLQLWDIEKRQLSATLQTNQDVVNIVRFSPDGKTLVSVGRKLRLSDTIVVWDVPSRTPRYTLTDFADRVTDLRFISSGTTFVSASANHDSKAHSYKSVKYTLWEAATGKQTGSQAIDSSLISCLSLSPDDKWIATSTLDDSTIHLWKKRKEDEK